MDRGGERVKPREFVYIGEPVPKIDPAQHREFLHALQHALLQSLAERELLTKEQARKALEHIESKGAAKARSR